MKPAVKILLIVAIALVVVGAAIFAGAMTFLHANLNGSALETKTYEITKDFEDLSIRVTTDDVSFVLSDDKSCKAVCLEREGVTHTVEVNGKTLEIGVNDTRAWYEHIGFFSFATPRITVYLPKDRYASLLIDTETGDVDIPKDFTFGSVGITGSTADVSCGASSEGMTKIKLSTGDIGISGASAGELDLSVSTGDIRLDAVSCEGAASARVSTGKVQLTDLSCESLTSVGSTGDVRLKNVIASGSYYIERSTGDVVLDGCDADELFLKTSTGDVTGTLLSEKIFITDTSTGSVDVPKTTAGGTCEITTHTGDIRIGLIEKE